jgi:hypothetical protein
MAINSITSGGMAAFQLQSRSSVGASSEKSPNSTGATKSQTSNLVKQSSAVGTVSDSNVASENLLTSKQKTAANENSSSSSGIASHVVVSYNQHGKLRTKFEDSRNNVVYQIPSEMAAKLEDQMLTSNSSTNVKV